MNQFTLTDLFDAVVYIVPLGLITLFFMVARLCHLVYLPCSVWWLDCAAYSSRSEKSQREMTKGRHANRCKDEIIPWVKMKGKIILCGRTPFRKTTK